MWRGCSNGQTADGADRRRARANAASLLAGVGLAPHALHPPAGLSGGEQQRVAIARALANDPRILLGDEPTGNLDHATGDSVLGTLLDLVRHTGLAALIATHNLDLARRLDRIVASKTGGSNRPPSLLIDKLRCYAILAITGQPWMTALWEFLCERDHAAEFP
jgi:ABC-type lipoprotein export system ATPase subunit